MYASFFGLRCHPFDDRADADFFHSTPLWEEILADAQRELRVGNGFVSLKGGAGTGKTIAIRTLLARLNDDERAVVLTWPVGGAADLLRETCKAFGVTVASLSSPARFRNRLRRHLARWAAAGIRPILFVDQAENLADHDLTVLAILADLRSWRQRLLRIVLVAEPRLGEQLARPEWASLRQLFAIGHALPILTEADTAGYILHRLKTAGAADAPVFDAAAIARIQHHARGVPRLINRIADAALRAAFREGEAHITVATIEEICAGQTASAIRSMPVPDLLVSTPHAPAPWFTAPDTPLRAEAAGAVVARIDAAEQKAAAILARLERAGAIAPELERLIARAEAAAAVAAPLADALRGLAGGADDKISRLASHHAAASSLLDRLTAAQQSGAASAQQFDRAAQDATNLDRATIAAQDVVAALGEKMEMVAAQTPAFEEQFERAERLVTRLTGVVPTVDRARRILDSLTELTAMVEPQTRALYEASAVAQGLIEAYERARADAQDAGRRLEEQSAAAAPCLDAFEHGVRDASAQLEAISAQLQEVSERVIEISEQARDATARPRALLESVQAQAAQFERVCTAVRKVFAALAQATLDAHSQHDDLRTAAEDASVRLAQLTAETDRATGTLREWVDEAARVQSRLERMVETAPTIHQTHPGRVVRSVSESLRALRDATPPADLAGLAHPDDSALTHVAPARTRAQQIARLIDEAQQADALVNS